MTWKKRLAISLLYVVFLAGTFEGLTRLAFAIPRFAGRLPVTDEDWWRNTWIYRHKYSGQEIYYEFDVYDSTKGWIARPNLSDRTVFGDKILNTNSRGLRGKREFAEERNAAKTRIVVLGDSFTFGDEVSDNETYCHYLQEMLPEVEVINMGVHGYGHDQMLILFDELGVRYEPDIVILGFVALDMPRNVLRFRDYAKPMFVVRDGVLELTGTPVPRPERVLGRDWTRSRALGLASVAWEKLNKSTGRYDRAVQETTSAILDEIAASARRVGAVSVFAYLPPGSEIAEAGLTAGEEFLFAWCEANDDVGCFSTRPHLAKKASGGTTFRSSGHWAPVGHLAVAEAIRDFLVGGGYVQGPGEPRTR